MRVIWEMRAGAILAASAVLAVGALSGCGQRGPLYMPTVPPLPAQPHFETEPGAASPASDASGADASGADASDASGADADSVPDTSGTPLSLAPDNELAPSSPSSLPAAPQAASDAQPTE